MKILQIKLASKQVIYDVLPVKFGIIERVPTNNFIKVTIIDADDEKEHFVQTDCKEDVYSMAECLQYQLDGYTGSKSEINEYYQLLERFMN